jgi:two-component system phosphate regulon sensor histidine kinase PhoR
METKHAMPAENVQHARARPGSGLRRFLWQGVLPEALGLCFVAIIFGGFAVAYVISDSSWQRRAAAVRQAEAEMLAQALATTLGATAGAEQVPEDTLRELSRLPRIRSLRWTAPEGAVKYAWPPTIAAVPGLPAAPPISGQDAAQETHLTVASVPVRTPAGTSAGTLRVEVIAPPSTRYQAALVWNWGVVAGVTLAVFAALYHRLRRHLRPIAAIERNLHSYVSGVEKELMALALSDSLGSVAQGWNRLISQLAEMQRRVQNGQAAGPAHQVLERFESALFRRVVERLPFGVLCVGDNQSVNYANAAAAALLGREPGKLIGAAVAEAIGDPGVVQAITHTQAGTRTGLAVDHTRLEGEQETVLRFRVLPLSKRATGGDALVTIEDVSQLREGQRARDNFLYHVTHELRTPLTNIHAYAETLTKPGFDDEHTRKECYNVIVSETRRLSTLVEDILSLSQFEVGSVRLDIGEVDLLRLLRQMVQDNLGASDEKRIDLTLVLPPKVPKISGDKQRLSVLLNNLIGNAIKYTPEGGQVQVKLEVTPRGLLISVQDNGIGIAAEDQPHVFEKFYRATSDAVQMVPGTGLGLAIAREVARLHGGEIQLESEPGKGSTFTVELPLPTAAPAEVPTL